MDIIATIVRIYIYIYISILTPQYVCYIQTYDKHNTGWYVHCKRPSAKPQPWVGPLLAEVALHVVRGDRLGSGVQGREVRVTAWED